MLRSNKKGRWGWLSNQEKDLDPVVRKREKKRKKKKGDPQYIYIYKLPNAASYQSYYNVSSTIKK
jgi:hypothetical protein